MRSFRRVSAGCPFGAGATFATIEARVSDGHSLPDLNGCLTWLFQIDAYSPVNTLFRTVHLQIRNPLLAYAGNDLLRLFIARNTGLFAC